MAGLVPALPGHVELERERRLVVAVSRGEVPAGAAGAFERLDLADEDAVHQRAGGIGRVGARGHEPVVVPLAVGVRRARTRVGEALAHLDAEKRWIAGELLDRE